uniref:Uncharacterized protein n=1 Tax=Arundo donax TaxID=35708 RepID=A0A0A9F5Z0_ARUDO
MVRISGTRRSERFGKRSAARRVKSGKAARASEIGVEAGAEETARREASAAPSDEKMASATRER